jgi:hypothetical protein
LRQVFGFGSISGEPVADIEDSARMLTYKLLPGRAISLEALLDQLGFLLQRKISLESIKAALGTETLEIVAGPGNQLQIRCLAPCERP